MRTKLANIVLIIGLGALLAGSVWFGLRVHASAKNQQEIKQDYSLINSVTFGIFSIDQWRDKLSDVINAQVNGYSITPQQRKDMQAAVEKQLHQVVAKVVAHIDKPQKSIGGKLKKMAFRTLVDSDSLQKQVKPFATTIVRKISSPASQARLKNIASSKINQLENETYDSTSEANDKVTKYIFQKYHVSDLPGLDKTVHERLNATFHKTINNAGDMLACVLAAIVLWWLMRKQVQLQTTLFIMSLLFAAVLLVVGLTSPVIEVDARIQTVKLVLMGQNIVFQNQVLFFQSKSIWGIITTLLGQQKPDAITVGVLILLFVVILPFLRLTARVLVPFAGNNKVVHYLAFEASKWDMADVIIVGLLMTYIGLNGILKSQLADLNIHNSTLTTNTVNYTSLQPGYFIFVGYVFFEILLSYILKRTWPQAPKPKKVPRHRGHAHRYAQQSRSPGL
jgi:hypothetical protein